MADVLVLYRTKYGSTEKYARWLAEDTGADLSDARRIRTDRLNEYAQIVYLGGLYAGGLLGFRRFRKHLTGADQNRIVVAVGATMSDKAYDEVRKANLPPEMRDQVSFHILRGGLDYPHMRRIDRFLMALLAWTLRRKPEEERDADAKGVLATYGKTVDFTRRAALAPVIREIQMFRERNRKEPT